MYELCKRQIANGCKTEKEREEMKQFLGCFMMNHEITPEQYMELSNMLKPVAVVIPSMEHETSPVVTEEKHTEVEIQA
ncbi:hypothetical protein JJB52_02175 [Clostridium perfringens]|nr:hypothetical protein [Clostridium perfringens]MBO3345747.1 hypothetical protein [Clostridium perfringens]MBO3348819.1 hypothetical protein [Clostridium perfringens]MBO3352068.1 hypothetical protein [Clostridium perfringens]MBO3363870.1 hypothetical protein [Clostridium perfringens]